MKETWKPIPEYEGFYEVSTAGRVRSVDRIVKNRWGNFVRKGTLLSPRPARHGYLRVALFNGKRKDFSIHELVASAFLSRPKTSTEVNHKNGLKDDNRLENIEFSTRLENVRHSIQTGLRKRRFTPEQIRAIRSGALVPTNCSKALVRLIKKRKRYADIY